MAWAVQRYLIFAILSCVPDRQRTLRELSVGRTLVKEGDTCGSLHVVSAHPVFCLLCLLLHTLRFSTGIYKRLVVVHV